MLRIRILAVAVLLSSFLFTTHNAWALNVQHFRPATGATKGYQVLTSDTLEQGRFSLGVVANYAQHMLTVRSGPGIPETDVVDDLLMLDFIGEVGIFDWLNFYFDMPLTAYHDIQPSLISTSNSGGGSAGDLLLRFKIRAFDAETTSTGLGLAFVPFVTFNTGSPSAFVGNKGVTGGLLAVGDWQIMANRFYINAGFRFRETEVIGPGTLTVGHEFLYGAGFQRPLVKNWDLDVLVEASGLLDTKQAGSQDGNPLEFLFYLQKRWLENKSLAMTVGASFGATEGYGAPRFRTLLGLAYVHPVKEAVEEPKPVRAPGLVTVEEDKLAISDKIHFAFNKATIRPESFPILDAVAQAMFDHPEIELVRIEGHTDALGSESYNQALSERRAKSVRQYLIKNGVAADRLEALGVGEAQPVDTNETEEGRANNRRTEFIIAKRR